MEEESLLILPDDESRLLLGDACPFSLEMEVTSPDIGVVRCNCNNFGVTAVGDCTT
jgi:hypothetical protein